MWRRFILAGTTAVALFTGTAFAFASPPAAGAPASESTVQLDHWSEMRMEAEDGRPLLVDHVDGTLGSRFPEMKRAMELYGPVMHGSDMHEFMNESGMHEFMNSPGMENFMNSPGMENFMNSPGMGGPA